MKSFTVLAAASALTLVAAQDAAITQNNPQMASIQANLQANLNVQGTITGVSNSNGTGVNFNVNFYSFPSSGGPFSYYIASSTVPTSNACSSLTTPFNPYHASTSSCDATNPASCAVGALSAKHGAASVTSDSSFQKFYLDLYTSTASGTEAYFGDLSIVVADKSGKPINCANFQASGTGASSASSSSGSMASATSSMTSAASSASAAATSSAAAVAQRVAGSGAALVAAIAALVV